MALQALAILVTLACGAALLAVALRSSGGDGVPPPTTSAVTPQQSAEQWLRTNASTAPILVDRPIRRDLLGSGMSATQVLAYNADGRLTDSATTQAPSFGFLALTSAIQAHPSGLVADLIARSAAIAQFGSGQQQVQIRQVVAGGLAASLPARRAAQAFRSTAGAELLANHAVIASEVAADDLRAGRVDSTLLSVLATLALAHRFTIRAFPPVAGENGPEDILRTAQLTDIDGRPIRPGDTAVSQVTGFFQSQVGAFHASQIHLTTDSTPALTVVFPLPALPA